jgi:hypothetical protein
MVDLKKTIIIAGSLHDTLVIIVIKKVFRIIILK